MANIPSIAFTPLAHGAHGAHGPTHSQNLIQVPSATQMPSAVVLAPPRTSELDATALMARQSADTDSVNPLTDNADSPSLEQVSASLTEMMSVMRKGLAFHVDENSGKAVVTVMDKDTGDVIRQMPSEEALALAEKMSEITGILMKTEA